MRQHQRDLQEHIADMHLLEAAGTGSSVLNKGPCQKEVVQGGCGQQGGRKLGHAGIKEKRTNEEKGVSWRAYTGKQELDILSQVFTIIL